MTDQVDLREFLSGFLAEAGEHLRSIQANLVLVDEAVRRNAAAPRAVRELFRSLHTIKGLAGMVGVEPIVELSHAMETVLRAAERAGGHLPLAAFEPLLEGTQAIAQRVRALAEDAPVTRASEALLDRLAAVEIEAPPPGAGRGGVSLDPALAAKLAPHERDQVVASLASGHQVAEVSFSPSAERAAQGLTITTVRTKLAELGEIVKVIPVSNSGAAGSSLRFLLLVVSKRTPAELAHAAGIDPASVRAVESEDPVALEPLPDDSDGGGGGSSPSVVRVAVGRVDDALDGLSALLVTRMRLSREVERLAAAGADVRELRQVTLDVARQLAHMRRAVVGLRMLAVEELLEPLPLLVRGLRAATGKDVVVVIDAGHVEVDKAVAERLWPAVVHLVRNAVDHGIEAAEVRRALGKPERGTITVRSRQLGSGRIEVTVEDDGRGIDRARVAAKAGRPVPSTDAELLDLVTAPGLSTRDRADATSGRGMGLDIARRAVEQLGGDLGLGTMPGRGTRFTLRAPVTVAIIDAVAFQCASQTFLVPVAAIDELVEVVARDLVSSPALRVGEGGAQDGGTRRSGTRQSSTRGARARLLPLRGVAVPFFELIETLGLGTRAAGEASAKAILVRREERSFAFGVDRLLGHHAVVVRPLRDPLVTVRGVSGATDLGDGRPTLILDLHALMPRLSEGRAA